jgi:carnitine-CoA ligase
VALTGLPSAVAALRSRAETTPERPFLVLGGTEHTYAEVWSGTQVVAEGLAARGLAPGDRLAIVADNSLETVLTWLGAGLLSLVDVPVNANARGEHLAYMLRDAQPAGVVAGAGYAAAVGPVLRDLPGVRLAAVIGDQQADGFTPFAAVPVPVQSHRSPPGAGTLATIMYTSGTTGPSKGVMQPHGYYPWYGARIAELLEMGPAERLYCAQPLYHIDGRAAVMGALISGGSVALAPRFSATRFWSQIRAASATRFFYVGSMLWMLHKQPPSPDDAGQPARIAIGSSTPVEIHEAFEQRFGVQLLDTFGMTEGALLTGVRAPGRRPGTMGRPLAGIEISLRDELDNEAGTGRTGEIAFRVTDAGVVPLGYWNKPAETVEAWRNLWFHTGDLARQEPDGHLVYVGRKKDVIRRRGENVSAWELEQALLRLDAVADVAAFGVPSDVGEEDVAVVVVVHPGAAVDPAALRDQLSRNVPAFMLPRFIELAESLPKTASHRVEKGKIRARGIAPSAWDAMRDGPPGEERGVSAR